MSLLSTGEMINELEVGEEATAYTVTGHRVPRMRVTKYKDESIIVIDSNQNLQINGFTIGLRWKIEPDYISFDEAMEALKKGEAVELHRESFPETTIFRDWYKLESREHLKFKDLFEGKWTIIDE